MKNSNVAIKARRDRILKIIQRSGQLSTNDLSAQFDVSLLTLRRDLDFWEKEGCVQRFHGGVRFVASEKEIPKFDEKLQSHITEKQAIASYIAGLIPPETTLFLNSGTSVLEIMSLLKDKGETIITNNALAFETCEGGNCDIICTGGEYNSITKSYNGEMSRNILSKTFAEFCVLGVNGISASSGITTSIFQETLVNELMVRQCNGLHIIAADSGKIGRIFRFVSTGLDRIDMLVTVSSADKQELEAIAAKGVEIILADTVAPPREEAE